MPDAHNRYHKSQTYKVCEIEFSSEESDEEVYEHGNKCNSKQ